MEIGQFVPIFFRQIVLQSVKCKSQMSIGKAVTFKLKKIDSTKVHYRISVTNHDEIQSKFQICRLGEVVLPSP